MIFQAAKDAGATFSLFNQKNKDLFYKIKNNIVGGPSIIFTRKHIAGETMLRNNPDKLCQRILGFDANALYLYCIGQDMPVGPYIRRFEFANFKPERSLKYDKMFDWLDWLMKTENYEIQHKLNTGREKKIGPFFVDGYDERRETIFEFNGCYYHGHQCRLTEKVKNENWLRNQPELLKRTELRRKYINNEGYNVMSIWECDYDNLVKDNVELKEHIHNRLPTFFKENRYEVAPTTILDAVRGGNLYGMLEVDIEVPETWSSEFETKMPLPPREYFSEMSPLFCTTEIPFEKIGKPMQDYAKTFGFSERARTVLVGGYKAKQILLATDLLKWYLDHGLRVTRIYEVIEYTPQKCFAKFTKTVTEARRLGDIDPTQEVMATTMKLIGNSGYGSMIMDKEKQHRIFYSKNKRKTQAKVNDKHFRKLNELETDSLFEIEMAKSRITQNMPVQIGFVILQLAKRRMLEFYYDFMNVYCDRESFEYIEMDTDSAYMAISESNLLDIIKLEKRSESLDQLKNCCHLGDIDPETHWFPRGCCQKHRLHDTRTAGLFKLEFEGERMIGLSSKTYVVQKVGGQTKISCKGINKRNLTEPFKIYENVLKNQKSIASTNMGFRLRQNKIFTYQQTKFGLSYFYCKREVLQDGIRTAPLNIVLTPIKRNHTTDTNSFSASGEEAPNQSEDSSNGHVVWEDDCCI